MSEHSPSISKAQATLIIVTVALAIFMVNVDTSIVNIALPTLAKEFNADPADVSKVILSYLLAMSSTLLLFGRLGDLKGTEKIFTFGYLIFTVGSLLCALSNSLDMLIGFRLLQGLGGAILFSSWGAIVMKYLPPEIRGRAFGTITVAAGAGIAVGPPIGGFLVDFLNWHWIFLINIPVGIAAIALCWKLLLGNTKKKSTEGKVDIPGAAFSVLMLVAFFYLFEIGPKKGWTSPATLGMIAAMLLFGIFFVIREAKFDSPLVNLNLFKNHNLSFSFGARMLVMLILGGVNFLLPFFFEGVRGLQPATVGMVLMIFPLTSFIGSPMAGYFADKSNNRLIRVVACILIVTATFLLWQFRGDSSWFMMISSFVIFGLGVSLFMTANITVVMSHAPRGNEGMVTAIVSVVGTIGSAVGVNLGQIVYSLHLPKMEGAADHIHASADAMTKGFHNALIIIVIAAVINLSFSFFAKEKQRTT